eukprot:TRINITY_DN695_c1_g1_i1.p1 TRINITY_DN695_c1_g1~~TRINITY_DN695_c1_g1_i1.p1  ORF type:complete len:761 (-),score=287.03 TRINITY_DN695_c1_g1_i1:60-2342(-)
MASPFPLCFNPSGILDIGYRRDHNFFEPSTSVEERVPGWLTSWTSASAVPLIVNDAIDADLLLPARRPQASYFVRTQLAALSRSLVNHNIPDELASDLVFEAWQHEHGGTQQQQRPQHGIGQPPPHGQPTDGNRIACCQLDSSSAVLAYAAGRNLDSLCVRPIDADTRREALEAMRASASAPDKTPAAAHVAATMTMPIRQIEMQPATADDYGTGGDLLADGGAARGAQALVGVRSGNQCMLLTMRGIVNRRCQVKPIDELSFRAAPVHLALRPVSALSDFEAAVSTADGGVYRWLADRSVGVQVLRPAASEQAAAAGATDAVRWSQLAYGAHPCTLLMALPNVVRVVDFRAPPVVQHDLVHCGGGPAAAAAAGGGGGDEQITCMASHPQQPFQFALGTTQRVMLFDERFSSQPLLHWRHWQQHAPRHVLLTNRCSPRAACNVIVTHNFRAGDIRVYAYEHHQPTVAARCPAAAAGGRAGDFAVPRFLDQPMFAELSGSPAPKRLCRTPTAMHAPLSLQSVSSVYRPDAPSSHADALLTIVPAQLAGLCLAPPLPAVADGLSPAPAAGSGCATAFELSQLGDVFFVRSHPFDPDSDSDSDDDDARPAAADPQLCQAFAAAAARRNLRNDDHLAPAHDVDATRLRKYVSEPTSPTPDADALAAAASTQHLEAILDRCNTTRRTLYELGLELSRRAGLLLLPPTPDGVRRVCRALERLADQQPPAQQRDAALPDASRLMRLRVADEGGRQHASSDSADKSHQ